jgi:LexA-binding, inner membrane-associated putative hydrolase
MMVSFSRRWRRESKSINQAGTTMANFNTHIAAGAVASGLGATAAVITGISPASELATLVAAGVIGSILPDIDQDKGTPLHFLFGVLGLGLAFSAVLNLGWLPWWELAAIWCAVFIWHSVLAALLFAAVTTAVLSAVFGKAPAVSWLAGAFMAGGYLVHLTLDEIYAVDLHNRRVKRSFGTALKLWDYRSPVNSGIMAAAVLGLLFLAPSPKPLVSAVHASQPNQHWAAK